VLSVHAVDMTACLTEPTVRLLPEDTFHVEYFSHYERGVVIGVAIIFCRSIFISCTFVILVSFSCHIRLLSHG